MFLMWKNNKVNDSHDVEQLIKELSFSYQKTLKLIWECFVVLNTPIWLYFDYQTYSYNYHLNLLRYVAGAKESSIR